MEPKMHKGMKQRILFIKVLYALIIGTHKSGAVIDTRVHCN